MTFERTDDRSRRQLLIDSLWSGHLRRVILIIVGSYAASALVMDMALFVHIHLYELWFWSVPNLGGIEWWMWLFDLAFWPWVLYIVYRHWPQPVVGEP